MRSLRHHRSSTSSRAGLAPVELIFVIPVWLMLAALMILVGTTGAWKVRGHAAAREAAFRSLWPRTRSADRNSKEWFPSGARMSVQRAQTQVETTDRLADHAVIRGPVLIDPRSHGQIGVNASVMDPRSMAINGEAFMLRAAATWRRLGYQYRIDREFPILDGNAGQFVPGVQIPNDQRRSIQLWDFTEYPLP
jgi:hypothetical protein